MTYFAEAKVKAMESAEAMAVEAVEAVEAVKAVEAVEAAPAVAAVKSVDAKPSPAAVVPTFYNFPAFTYPITQYFLLPVTAPVVTHAAAAPVAAEVPAVEEA